MRPALMILALAGAGLTLGLIAADEARTAPQPSDVTLTWQLEFDWPQPPTPIRFRPAGSQIEKTYWFFRFTVANTTGDDQLYIPEFVIYTDTGQMLRAGQNVPTGVFAEIKRIYNAPLLKEASALAGTLIQGRDNARQGVAIFSDIDPNAGAFDLFVGGLSGDTEVITLPRPIEVETVGRGGEPVTAERTKVTLSKTLRLRFSLPGEASARHLTEPELLSRNWVMR